MASGERASPTVSQPCDGGSQLASPFVRPRRREAAASGGDGSNSKRKGRNPGGRGRGGVSEKCSSSRSQMGRIRSVWVPVKKRDELTETGSDGVNGKSCLSSKHSEVVGGGDGDGLGRGSGVIQVVGSGTVDVVSEGGGGSIRGGLIVESGASKFEDALGKKEVGVGMVGLESATLEHFGGSVGDSFADLSRLSRCDVENATSDVPKKNRRMLRKERFNKLDRNRNLDVQVNSSYQGMENYAENSDVVSERGGGSMRGGLIVVSGDSKFEDALGKEEVAVGMVGLDSGILEHFGGSFGVFSADLSRLSRSDMENAALDVPKKNRRMLRKERFNKLDRNRNLDVQVNSSYQGMENYAENSDVVSERGGRSMRGGLIVESGASKFEDALGKKEVGVGMVGLESATLEHFGGSVGDSSADLSRLSRCDVENATSDVPKKNRRMLRKERFNKLDRNRNLDVQVNSSYQGMENYAENSDVVSERGGRSMRGGLIVESGGSKFEDALGKEEVAVGMVGLDSVTLEHFGGSFGVFSADLSRLSRSDMENAALDVPKKNRRMFRKERFNKLDRNRNLDVQVNSSYQGIKNYAENSDVASRSLTGLINGQSVVTRVPRVGLDNRRMLENLDDGGRTDACIGEFSKLGLSTYEESFRLNRGLAEGDLLSSQQLDLPESYSGGELKEGSVLSSVIEKGDWLSQNNIVEGGLNEPAGTESVSLKANNPKSSLDEILKMKTKKQWKSKGKVRVPLKSETENLDVMRGFCAGPSYLKVGMQIEGEKSLMHSSDTRKYGMCIGESSKHVVSGYEHDMRLAMELSEGDLLSSRQADHTESPVHERSDSLNQNIRTGNEVKRGVRESTSLKPDKANKTKSSLDRDNNKRKQPKFLGKVKGPQTYYKNMVVRSDLKEQKLLKKMARRERMEAFFKKFRPDPRGEQMISEHIRMLRRQLSCPVDIDRANEHFSRIYASLLLTKEEKAKRKQSLTLLETLVSKEWPHAKLHVFGSCENSFGIINSDLDICLSIDDENIDKSAFLLELAAILKDGHLQNVEPVVRTRVPIVKFLDPSTGISGDISVNNYLPLVNTKLLRDYAGLDGRVRQLALIVKHWAKSRGVNGPFNRTLSSYTYVLMCINFLQQREPVILPCLQAMLATYATTVNGIECAFFDQVDEICHFGSNKESISQLVWGFFNYWAYHHDYKNAVISVRTGSILSKLWKDWATREQGQRYTHFISIEDPLDTTIDLGRRVDCRSLKILREEFERAAQIMQDDPQPWISLFETYVVPPFESFQHKSTPVSSSQ